MDRREAGLPKGVVDPAGVMLRRNPGVAMVWITTSYEVWKQGRGSLIAMGEPLEVLWFAEGRAAKTSEVRESIGSGLPSLMAITESDEERAELNLRLERTLKLLPKESE
jgi:hypothetical protein